MNRSLLLLLVLLLSGCATFQVSTLNHDPIYSIEGSDAEITVIDNEFELQRLLRTDFNFRFDFAQYALRQPRSFDWNNRILGNRYNYYNPYYSRSQMWNDWVWGYNWHSPHRWSPFGYDRWGYNNYGYGMGWSYSWNNRRWSSNQWGNPYGWNNYYGWNTGHNTFYGNNYNRRTSTSYINGRRGRVTQTVVNRRRTTNNNNNDQTIRLNTRTIRSTESSNNGGRSRIRQNIPSKPVRVRQPRTIQPRQVRGGQRPPVLQQTRTSSQSNVKGRNGSSRRKN